MPKLLVMLVGLACAASLAAAESQPRKVWTARDVIIASGGVPPEDMPAAQAAPAEPGAAAEPVKAKVKTQAKAKAKTKAKTKAKAAAKAKKKAAKRAKKPRAKVRR